MNGKSVSRAPDADPRSDREIEERIRRAAASAAQAAEQRAADRILALEEDLERAKEEAAAKVAELEARVAEMQTTASEAEREFQLTREVELRLRAIEDRLLEVTSPAYERSPRARPGDSRATPPDVDETDATGPEATPQPNLAARTVSLADASYEELRACGMSVTQAKRVLAYRGRLEGFESFKDLDRVPGFPRPFLAQIKDQLTR